MKSIFQSLEAQVIDTNKILLDPNNPRFCAFKRQVSPARASEKGVQDKTLQKIFDEDVDQIKESILQVGFLPIDRIVVVRLQAQSEFFVTVEGNRRLAAVKSILRDVEEEGLDVEQNILNTLKTLSVLVLKGENYDSSSDSQLLIQGLRHISGIKSWQPYQQAKSLVALTAGGTSITDAAKAIGVGRSKASWMQKAFHAFENMRKLEEIELPDDAEAISLFSYFVELLKDVYLRQYFGWSDEKNKFENEAEILKFYHWIGVYDPNEDGNKQIPAALDIRKLASVLRHQEAKRIFESGSNIDTSYTLSNPPPAATDEDYSKQIQQIQNTLNTLPSSFVKHMGDQDKEALRKIIKITSEHLGI